MINKKKQQHGFPRTFNVPNAMIKRKLNDISHLFSLYMIFLTLKHILTHIFPSYQCYFNSFDNLIGQ